MVNETHNNEHHNLYKILNFRLSHRFKKIGLIAASLLFLILLGSKFFGYNIDLAKDVLRTLVLLSLLVSTVSKDKLEDEYNRQIRFHSFVIAFVAATVYAIMLPLVAIVLDLIVTKLTGGGPINFYEISAFEVLFCLLGFQLLAFETLKRFGRA